MKVVFRTDASLQIGNGHVMRCLSLADALRRDGATCLFVCLPAKGDLVQLIRQRGYVVHPLSATASPLAEGLAWADDAAQTHALLAGGKVDWIVVDHYSLDARWETVVRSATNAVLAIDDLCNRPHDCDFLLDQGLEHPATSYRPWVPAGCRALAGPRFALMDPAFAAARHESLARRHAPSLSRVLVSMGGVDAGNATREVLESLRDSPLSTALRVEVVIGPSCPHHADLKRLAASLPFACSLHVGVSDMARRLAACDLAIGAGGTSSWERCALGVPSILLPLAKNQIGNATRLGTAGAVIAISDTKELRARLPSVLAGLDAASLGRMSVAASDLCDGLGASRAAAHLLAAGCRVDLMREADLEDVLRWRNDPEVRQGMFTQHEITPLEHRDWFNKASADPLRHLLVVRRGMVPLGFAHFSLRSDGAAAWGFYRASEAPRGSGLLLGTAVLNHGFGKLGLSAVSGEVLPGNLRSVALHERLGFSRRAPGPGQAPRHEALRFGILASEWPAPLGEAKRA